MNKLYKRTLAVAVAVCLMLTAVFATGFAATDALVINKTNVSAGETFKVTFTQPTTEKISMLAFKLDFDKEALEITNIQNVLLGDDDLSPVVSTANTNGYFQLSHENIKADTNLAAGTVIASVDFKVKDGATPGAKTISVTDYELAGEWDDDSSDFVDVTPGTDVTGSLSKTVNVVVKLTGSQTIDITAPVKGATPQATIAEGAGYTGTISWNGNPTAFGANTAYTADVTLTAKTGYVFAADATAAVTGATVSNTTVASDGSTMSFKAKFPATAGADALGGTVTISNTNPVIGDTLTADTTGLTFGGESLGTLSYQWKAGGSNVGTNAATYTVTNADYNKAITVTVSNSNNSGAVTSAATAAVEKKAAPAAPTGYTVTATTEYTITVTENAAWEYSIDNGANWQDSNVFSNLTPNTAYNIVVRVKETADTKASAAGAAVSATTQPLAQVISGADTVTVVVGGTLDLNTAYTSNAAQTLTFTSDGNEPSGTTFNASTGVVTAGDVTGSFMVTINAAAKGQYAAAPAKTVTVTISEKAVAALAGGVTQTGCTYGETLSDPKFTAPTGATTTVTYSGTLTKDSSAYSSTTKPTEAGTYTVTVDCETADTIYSATSAAFTIAQKSISGMTVTLDKTTTEYSGTTQNVSVTAVGDLTAADYTVSGDTSATAVGDYTVTVTGKGNYKDSTTATWKITPKAITIAGATAENRPYAEGNTSVTITGVTFNEVTLTMGTDFTATGKIADANAANGKNVAVTVNLTNTNYTLAEKTTTCMVNIAQIAFNGNIALSKNYRTNTAHQAEIDLTESIKSIAGAAVKSASEGTDTDNIIDNVTIDGNKVKFDVANVADAGKTATINVIVKSTNYTDFTAVITVTTTDKEDVSDKITFADGELTYTGSAVVLENATISEVSGGTWTYSYAAVTGTLGTDGKPLNAGTYTVTATYEDDDNLGSKTANLTVKKAMPTGAPKYTAITGADKTLADAALTLTDSTITVDGTIKWVDDDGNELAGTTVVTANTYYKWLFVPTDTVNYENLTGTIKLWSKSSGGGGGATKKDDTTTKVEDKTEDKVEDKTEFTGKTFSDVASSAYYADAVKWAVEKGITTGVTDKTFAPNNACTRAEIVTFLWRAAGKPEAATTTKFADVSGNAYYAKAVAWAVEKGITTGVTDETFAPNNTCTRAEAVTFLYRAAGKPAVDGSAAFNDVAADAYFAAAVNWAQQAEITGGIGDGLFAPANSCTRAEIVSFLFRAAE